MSARFRAAVFDMDGLMFDTENLTYRLQREILAGIGVDYTAEKYRQTIGKRTADLESFFAELCGEGFDYGRFHEACRTSFVDYTDRFGVPVKPGLPELLDYLRDSGVKIALATSTTRQSAERILRISGTLGYFDELVCAGDVTRGKPSPEPFLKAAEKLGEQPQDCIALEDSFNGIRSAANAGMFTVMIPDMIEPTDEIRAMCGAVCGSLYDVKRLVQNDI